MAFTDRAILVLPPLLPSKVQNRTLASLEALPLQDDLPSTSPAQQDP